MRNQNTALIFSKWVPALKSLEVKSKTIKLQMALRFAKSLLKVDFLKAEDLFEGLQIETSTKSEEDS